jgi:hypothetical protein
VAIQKTGAELKRATPLITNITKALLNPISAAKLAINPMTQMKNIAGEVAKPRVGSETSQAPQNVYQDSQGNVITKEQYDALMAQQGSAQDVYQDEKGNVITKAEYDRLMALYAQGPQDVYQDEYGNTITKEQYDQIMSQQRAVPIQTQQPTVSSGGGNIIYPSGGGSSWGGGGGSEGTDTMQTSPVDITSGDILDQQVRSALSAIKAKAASGQSLTANEEDFVDFMAKATIQVGPMSGFGFYPIWPKKSIFPILPAGDIDKKLFSESDDEELPSFNKQSAGSFSSKENFDGFGNWCKI